MTQLLNLMLEDIQRRNFTESTSRAYLRIVEDFARYFNRAPDQLGPEHIREYIAHLFRDKKLSDNSVNQAVGASDSSDGCSRSSRRRDGISHLSRGHHAWRPDSIIVSVRSGVESD